MYPWRGQGLKEQEQKQSSLDNDSSEDDSDGEYSDNSSEDASDAVVFGDPYRVHALPPFMHSWAPGLTSIKRQSVWFLSRSVHAVILIRTVLSCQFNAYY